MNVNASKYGMSQIVRKVYSVEWDAFTCLAVHGYGEINSQSNVTYDQQCQNSDLIMAIRIKV